MRFSIVIPTYNRLSLLGRTLESVWAQELTDFEVLVVDDGSTDGTREWLTSQGPRIRMFTQTNRGPGAARNLGVQNAQGEYLAFLDSDDVWFPWALSRYKEAAEAYGNPSFLAGRPFRFAKEDELETSEDTVLSAKGFRDYLASGDQWRWWGVSSFVVRRDIFEAAKGFAEERMNGEDADLALRLGTAPGFVQVCNPATFGYREHGASVMKDFSKTVAGAKHALWAERSGRYPGGPNRARERWRILTRHLRPVALSCLSQGRTKDAWELYRAAFGWHLRLGRWKYLAGFPLKAALLRT